MSRERDRMSQIRQLVHEEARELESFAKSHRIPSAWDKSVARSIAARSGDTGDAIRAEGEAAGKLGFPLEYCPYQEDGQKGWWEEGHRIGRIFRETKPPSEDVIVRLAAILEQRLRSSEKDWDRHLMGLVAHERRQIGCLQSELAASQKRVKQLEGNYGAPQKVPVHMLRVTVYEGGGKFWSRVPGLSGAAVHGESQCQALLEGLKTAVTAMEGIIASGREDAVWLEWTGRHTGDPGETESTEPSATLDTPNPPG